MKHEDFIKALKQKAYLGDGLYAQHDGYHIVLSAPREDGEHHVGLEPNVLANFDQYRKHIDSLIKAYHDGQEKAEDEA